MPCGTYLLSRGDVLVPNLFIRVHILYCNAEKMGVILHVQLREPSIRQTSEPDASMTDLLECGLSTEGSFHLCRGECVGYSGVSHALAGPVLLLCF